LLPSNAEEPVFLSSGGNMGRSFYLYPKIGTYHAEILDPETGQRFVIELQEKNRGEAMFKVAGWHTCAEKGRPPVYLKPEAQAIKAITGL
jgi:hypothetical protein